MTTTTTIMTTTTMMTTTTKNDDDDYDDEITMKILFIRKSLKKAYIKRVNWKNCNQYLRSLLRKFNRLDRVWRATAVTLKTANMWMNVENRKICVRTRHLGKHRGRYIKHVNYLWHVWTYELYANNANNVTLDMWWQSLSSYITLSTYKR